MLNIINYKIINIDNFFLGVIKKIIKIKNYNILIIKNIKNISFIKHEYLIPFIFKNIILKKNNSKNFFIVDWSYKF